jgi:hypothetical protein
MRVTSWIYWQIKDLRDLLHEPPPVVTRKPAASITHYGPPLDKPQRPIPVRPSPMVGELTDRRDVAGFDEWGHADLRQ